MIRTAPSIIFLSSFTLSNLAMHPITVNDRSIKDILNPDQLVLSYTNDKNHIAFKMKNGVIDLGTVKLSDTEIKDIRQRYEALNARKSELAKVIGGKGAEVGMGGPTRIDTAYIYGGEYITVRAGSHIDIENSLFESKKINASCCKFVALSVGAFVVANRLIIESKVPNSLIKAISFVFSPAVSDFAYLEGTVNFENNEVGAPFFVFGSQEMHIEFAPEVLE